MRLTTITIAFLLFMTGCKTLESNISGKYIDRERDDTLNIKADKTYEFEERLKTGERGWNTGNWRLDRNAVSFFNTKPLPLVGYKLRITKTGTGTEPLRLDFVMDGFRKKVQIIEALAHSNDSERNNSDVELVSNKIVVKTANFDSLRVKLTYFPTLSFSKKRFDQNGIYEIVVYPADRLYELDKLSYKYRNGSLINRRENIRYRKI